MTEISDDKKWPYAPTTATVLERFVNVANALELAYSGGKISDGEAIILGKNIDYFFDPKIGICAKWIKCLIAKLLNSHKFQPSTPTIVDEIYEVFYASIKGGQGIEHKSQIKIPIFRKAIQLKQGGFSLRHFLRNNLRWSYDLWTECRHFWGKTNRDLKKISAKLIPFQVSLENKYPESQEKTGGKTPYLDTSMAEKECERQGIKWHNFGRETYEVFDECYISSLVDHIINGTRCIGKLSKLRKNLIMEYLQDPLISSKLLQKKYDILQQEESRQRNAWHNIIHGNLVNYKPGNQYSFAIDNSEELFFELVKQVYIRLGIKEESWEKTWNKREEKRCGKRM